MSDVFCNLEYILTRVTKLYSINAEKHLKRLFAILMLGNILFNSFGYLFLSYILEKKASNRIEAKFDANDYDESKLIEIKIPFNLPYSMEWKDFERFNGEIELNGVYYKYVKRKVIVDSLVLLCLPDPSRHHFESARENHFELVNGLKHPVEKGPDTSLLKNIITKYISQDNFWTLATLPEKQLDFFIKNSCFISLFNLQKLVKPPAVTV